MKFVNGKVRADENELKAFFMKYGASKRVKMSDISKVFDDLEKYAKQHNPLKQPTLNDMN